MICFEDVEVGDELPELNVELSSEQVRRFAELAHINDRRFISDVEARSLGIAGQIIPGNLSMAILSRLVTDWDPCVRMRRFSLTLRQLARPGRHLIARGFVTDKHLESGTGLIDCDLILEDEGEVLATGTVNFELPRRET